MVSVNEVPLVTTTNNKKAHISYDAKQHIIRGTPLITNLIHSLIKRPKYFKFGIILGSIFYQPKHYFNVKTA